MDAKWKRMVPAGQFKNQCLALMDEVAKSGAEIVVTKHGRAVVRIIPADSKDERDACIFGCLAGSVTYNEADINLPIDEVWDADKD